MSEKGKMLAGELYDAADPQLTRERDRASELMQRYNSLSEAQQEQRRETLQSLLGRMGENVVIRPPFMVDYGYNIEVGDNFFANYGLIILDCNRVTIGDNVLIGPNVQIYPATHPLDCRVRRQNLEFAERINIGNDVWLGGGVIVCKGVTIADNVTIGAGSVVTKDIPANVLAAGNPCRIIRRLDESQGDK